MTDTKEKQEGDPITFGEAIALYGFREATEMLRAHFNRRAPQAATR